MLRQNPQAPPQLRVNTSALAHPVVQRVDQALRDPHVQQSIQTLMEPRAMNPQYEEYEYYDGRKLKRGKRERPIPDWMTEEQKKALKSVRKWARRLDSSMSICGKKFGWSFIIGFLPIVGDFADLFLSYQLVIKPSGELARACDSNAFLNTNHCFLNSDSVGLQSRMLRNTLFAFLFALVPFAGDFVLAWFKANSRNCEMLEEYLRVKHLEGANSTNTVKKRMMSRALRIVGRN